MKRVLKDTVSEYKPIKEWREDDRPREKLAKHGPSVLSDAELLAIIIQNGTVQFSALDIARSLLEKHENISKLASCDMSEFRHIKGIGDAKSVTLSAAFELGKRIQNEIPIEKLSFRSPEEIAGYLIPRLRGLRTEVFRALLLNSGNQVIREAVISNGTLNTSIVHPREVFRLAISESAASIIVVHNHPSGNPEPSKEDIEVTNKLAEAGRIIDIRLLDHIIIAGNQYTSFIKRGLL